MNNQDTYILGDRYARRGGYHGFTGVRVIAYRGYDQLPHVWVKVADKQYENLRLIVHIDDCISPQDATNEQLSTLLEEGEDI